MLLSSPRPGPQHGVSSALSAGHSPPPSCPSPRRPAALRRGGRLGELGDCPSVLAASRGACVGLGTPPLSLEKEKKMSPWLLVEACLPPSLLGLLSITVAGTGDTWPGQGRGSCSPGVKRRARPAEGMVLGPPPPYPPVPAALQGNLLPLLEGGTSFGVSAPIPRALGSSSGFCRARPVACSSWPGAVHPPAWQPCGRHFPFFKAALGPWGPG